MIKPGDCKGLIHYNNDDEIEMEHNLEDVTDLLSSFPETFAEKPHKLSENDAMLMGLNMANNTDKKWQVILKDLLNAPFKIREAFFKGYYNVIGTEKWNENISFECEGKIGAMGLYYLAKSIGYTNIAINTKINKPNIYRIYTLVNSQSNKVRKIYELESTEQYVYDLETSLGRFQAGVGETVVFNTDSVKEYDANRRHYTWQQE
jgi:hypothetical protein